MNTPNDGSADLAAIQSQLATVSEQMGYLVKRQQQMEELVDELMPIGRLALAAGAEQLQELEDKGYGAFGKELVGVLDRVVEAYSAEDVRRLGDNVVAILDTVRSITQPDVMHIVGEATNAIHEADNEAPKGLWGMMQAAKDEDARKGLGVVLGVLRHIGRAAGRMAPASGDDVAAQIRARRPGLARALAPRLRTSRLPPPREASPADECRVAAAAPAFEDVPEIPGVELTAEGFLSDPQTWREETGTAMAAALGVELGDGHWKLVEFARADWSETGTSPNVRRIAKGAGITTRELYRLFPRAPAKTVAKIAGIPKPAGCI